MQVQLSLSDKKPTQADRKPRFQSGCIPYRDVEGVGRQILLVKKKTRKAWWGFTKGGLEKHLNKKENAAKECWEEAGVAGVVTKKIGEFSYRKDNRKQIVYMFAMQFHTEMPTWQEMRSRKRKWFTLAEARDKLSREHHKFIDKIAKLPRHTHAQS